MCNHFAGITWNTDAVWGCGPDFSQAGVGVIGGGSKVAITTCIKEYIDLTLLRRLEEPTYRGLVASLSAFVFLPCNLCSRPRFLIIDQHKHQGKNGTCVQKNSVQKKKAFTQSKQNPKAVWSRLICAAPPITYRGCKPCYVRKEMIMDWAFTPLTICWYSNVA